MQGFVIRKNIDDQFAVGGIGGLLERYELSDQVIQIRADYRVEYEICKRLMVACGEIGATDLIYAAFEE